MSQLIATAAVVVYFSLSALDLASATSALL
jgi:hypothetical protein